MLANDAPEEARALVRTFTATWATDAKTLTAADLDEHEHEFDKVLRMSRKKRGEWMAEVKATRDAARDGRSPKDIARIDKLEAEKKALEAVRPDSLAQQHEHEHEFDKVLRMSQRGDREGAGCRERTESRRTHCEAARLGAETYPGYLRDQMLALHDQVSGIAETLGEIGAGEQTEEPES